MAERLIEPDRNPSKTAFIDLEASGLSASSWPIEVGWAFEFGPPRSLLIRPDDSWPQSAWSADAERLHGVTRADLDRDGRSARETAEALNDALAGLSVWSDAPDWDGFWLFRLFQAAQVKQQFTLNDFGKLMRPLAGAREEAALRRAAQISPRRHRAGPDAKHLQTVYALARRSTPTA
ncbi:MAG: hypothetical protein HXY23_10665 [Parvularculaceae bacterium]|jgi:hypothetical protein|nr:hypothetical protein [Parvularculaceae bacterium]